MKPHKRPNPLLLACVLAGATSCIDYGVSRELKSDSWKQRDREGGVDILWIIDDSTSMYEEQEQLATHTGTFVSFVSSMSIDFYLMVTTTDAEHEDAGAIVGDVLTMNTEDLAETFADQITARSEGSREERGFDVTLLAADPEGVNSKYLHSSADLELVFFTDEDDQSDLETGAFVESLKALRPGQQVGINAIVGDLPEGCASLLAAADPGHKYVEAQEQVEGLRESICSSNYEALLERMALKVLGLDYIFALSDVPDLDSIEVRVDDALVHQRDRHGWRYDAGDNTLVFDGYAVPPPGSEISAKYHPWTAIYNEDTGK